MVIVVEGADASANNIGQVLGLPIVWDVDAAAYTAAIPTTFATLSEPKKRALNVFIKGLKNKGLWTKITNLYLPIWGATSRLDAGVNVKTPADNINFPVSGATATYDSKGIKFLLGWATPFSKDFADIHTGFYNTTARADVDTLCAGIARSANEWNVGRRVLTGKNAGVLVNAVLLRPNVPNHLTSIGPIIASSKLSSNFTSVQVDTEFNSVSQAFDPIDPNTSVMNLGGVTAGANTSIHDTSMGLFTFGSSLNQTELADYAALQITLMTALMAA